MNIVRNRKQNTVLVMSVMLHLLFLVGSGFGDDRTDSTSETEWLQEASNTVQQQQSGSSTQDSSAGVKVTGGVGDIEVEFFGQPGVDYGTQFIRTFMQMPALMAANHGVVAGAGTGVASMNLASAANQGKQAAIDMMGIFINQLRQMEAVERATVMTNKSITLVDQGFENLRILGDPAKLTQALGLGSLTKFVDESRNVMSQPLKIEVFLNSVSKDGQKGSLSNDELNLAKVKVPEKDVEKLDTKAYYGFDSLKNNYTQFLESARSLGDSDEKILDELNTALTALCTAESQSEIMILQTKIASLINLLEKNASDESRALLRILLQDTMHRSQWEAIEMAKRELYLKEMAVLYEKYKTVTGESQNAIMNTMVANDWESEFEASRERRKEIIFKNNLK